MTVKETLPQDKAAQLQAEANLRKREAEAKVKEAALTKRALEVCARGLALSAKAEHGIEIDPAELASLGSEVEIELAVLRKVAAGKKTPKLPATQQIDKPGQPGPVSTGNLEADVQRQLTTLKTRR